MPESRTKNVAVNASVGLICQIIGLIFSFLGRTFFIKILGVDYLGVNGLFTNILTILSFAELGIGNAIIFSMYKPLAEKNTERLKSLMVLYKTAYRVIGVLVLVIGICCVPFLNYIINDKPAVNENLHLIYILYLLNVAVSYFYTYKKSIISADQKNYVVVLYTQVFQILCIVIQIAFLYFTHNFIIYLVIQISFTFITNIFLSYKADKMYPFLKESADKLEKNEINNIFKNVKALVMYKFGSIVLNGTDNLIISAMIGVKQVGFVSNYLLILNTVIMLLGKIFEGFTSSVGNLNSSADKNQRYSVFNKMFLINTWLYGFASVGIMLLIQEVIKIWIGAEYTLDIYVVFALILHFYINGAHNTVYTYRTTLGYFVQGRYTPLCAAVLNVVLSVVLCRYIGLSGIFFATSISRFFVIGVVDIYLVFKKSFSMSPFKYYIRYFTFIIIYALLYFICRFAIDFIPFIGIGWLFLKILIISIIFNLIMILLFYRTKSFKELIISVKNLKRWY